MQGRAETGSSSRISLAPGVVAALASLAIGFFVGVGEVGAAVEPGLYFDPARAAQGDRVALIAEADFLVCISASGGGASVGSDWPVFLADASVASLGAKDRIELRGEWSPSEAGMTFAFDVPRVRAGTYRAFVECGGDRLDASRGTLAIAGPPDTATEPVASDAPGPMRLVAGVVAVALGLVVASRRFGRAASRR